VASLAPAARAGIGTFAAALGATLFPAAEFSIAPAISTVDPPGTGLVGFFGIRLVALAAGAPASAIALRAGLVELAFSIAGPAGHLALLVALAAANEIITQGAVFLRLSLDQEAGKDSHKSEQEEQGVSDLHRENRR
jgi:hypothetical protein